MDALAADPALLGVDLRQFDRVLVLAPHPDDEVFGCCAVMALGQAMELEMQVHIITDGEQCFGALPDVQSQQLRQQRQQESRAAASSLQWPAPQFWGLPDSQLMQHLDSLQRKLEVLCEPGTLCVSTWFADGHPDHEAVGLCARALQQAGRCRALFYPIWSLVDPPRHAQWLALPGRTAVRLTSRQWEQKHAAAQLFRSQLRHHDNAAPEIVSSAALAHFVSHHEHYWHED
ncbi:MAG: PIG-L deacetylase family protein [Comamonas sp.]